MRYRTFPALFLAASLVACGAEPPAFTPAQRDALATEVEETLVDLTEAMNSHDPDRILGYFRDSNEFLYLGCTDFLLGFGSFSTRIGPYYVANPEVTFRQEIVRIQVLSPTVAVAALRGSSSDADALFWTEVLVKEGGRWLIAHEHESWPGCSPPSEAHPFTAPGDMTGTDLLLPDSGSGGS